MFFIFSINFFASLFICKQSMVSILLGGVQNFLEKGSKGELYIEYYLSIPESWIINL